MRTAWVLVLWTMALAGCAGTLSRSTLRNADVRILEAEALGAAEVAPARVHLALAKDELAAARRLSAEDDERANAMLERAAVDAELAVRLSKEAKVHGAALEAAAGLRAKDGWEAVAPAPALGSEP
jgi:hypothetical protein